MKLGFSRITKGFALAGLSFGLLADAYSLVHGLGNDAVKSFISDHMDLMVWLCPPSIGFMSFENRPVLSEVIEVYIEVAVLNTLLYAALGLIISQIYHLSRKFIKPKAE